MSVGQFGMCCCDESAVGYGQKSLGAIHWWAGFSPFMWEGVPFNRFRFFGRPPTKYRSYRWESTFEGYEGDSSSVELNFSFDPVYGDLASAYYRRVALSGNVTESYWTPTDGGGFLPPGFGGVTNVFYPANPDGCPWPRWDASVSQAMIPVHASPASRFLVVYEIPASNLSATQVRGTLVGEYDVGIGVAVPFTLRASVNLNDEVTIQEAAAKAAALLISRLIEPAPQTFNGNRVGNFDWIDPQATQADYQLVFDGAQYAQALANGQLPTTWVRLAYNRFTGDAIAVIGDNGFLQGSPGHVSAYGIPGRFAISPQSGGPYRSWDLPKGMDIIIATKTLLSCPFGLNCANRGPWPDGLDLRQLFDYEVVWPCTVATGERANPFIGRRDVAPGIVLFDPTSLRAQLNLQGFEFGDSYAGVFGKPPGSPEGCP